jgi:transposase
MEQNLTHDEVAILIRAKRIQKEKGIAAATSVSGICSTAGISRKTGYQWASKYETDLLEKQKELAEELSTLQSSHDQILQQHDDLKFQHEGLQLAWEIHRVDEMLEKKKP